MSFSEKYRQYSPNIVFFGMLLIVVSLFFSRFLISIGFIIVILSNILEGNYSNKLTYIKQHKAAFYIVLIIIFHIIGLIYTQNIQAGLEDIRIKSFILLILFYGSGKHLDTNKRNTVLNFYILSAFIASIISTVKFIFISTPNGIEDLRGIALVGDNLYQAIFINFAIILASYFIISERKHKYTFLYGLAIVFFIFYLYLLNSLTGYVIFIILLFVQLFYFIANLDNNKTKKYILLGTFLIISISAIYILTTILKFYNTDKIDYKKLPATTENGNIYTHDTQNKQFENGHYIYLYLCEKELKKEWNKRSSYPYSGLDKKGQTIKYTIIRYLSSKNLRKDSTGISQLSNKDIKNIENGYANFLYADNFSLKGRIYIIIWQLNKYINDNYADKQSISQRMVYIDMAWQIIKDNFWKGTGTGDAYDVTKNYFKKTKTSLSPKYINVVHNQFLLEFVILGIWGGTAFIFIYLFSYFKYKLWKNYLFHSFYIITTISFFAEFLFETQLGISFFSIFYALLLFQDKQETQTI